MVNDSASGGSGLITFITGILLGLDCSDPLATAPGWARLEELDISVNSGFRTGSDNREGSGIRTE